MRNGKKNELCLSNLRDKKLRHLESSTRRVNHVREVTTDIYKKIDFHFKATSYPLSHTKKRKSLSQIITRLCPLFEISALDRISNFL